VTKFAFPAVILCILGLFAYSVTSLQNNSESDAIESSAQPSQEAAPVAKADQSRDQPAASPVAAAAAEPQRPADDVKVSNDKIVETAALRAELLRLIQDVKSNSDKVAKSTTDQLDALRSDQAKLLKQARDDGDKSTLGLREEVSASQGKLVSQLDEINKSAAARFDAMTQRLDAMKKDLDDAKKSFEEERQNNSTITPTAALFIALATLLLAPFIAYQFTSNQLARFEQASNASRHRASSETENTHQVAAIREAAATRAEQTHNPVHHHAAPALGEDAIPHDDTAEEWSEGSGTEQAGPRSPAQT
jgi:hypothetical protein